MWVPVADESPVALVVLPNESEVPQSTREAVPSSVSQEMVIPSG